MSAAVVRQDELRWSEIARELLGFVWAIAVHIEQQQQQAVPTRLAA